MIGRQNCSHSLILSYNGFFFDRMICAVGSVCAFNHISLSLFSIQQKPAIIFSLHLFGNEKMQFQIHKTSKRSKICNHFCNDLFEFKTFSTVQKVLGHCLKTMPGFFFPIDSIVSLLRTNN